ncbi:MAG: TetR/AcrR family transcriptional regulator [Burkholderiaceae bacterium]
MKKEAESDARTKSASGAETGREGRAPQGRTRMPREVRRAQILAKAGEYFSEYGLTAQTRGLAQACGVSQRLLYSFFPTKAALLEQVYRQEIEGPFRATWLAQLRDRKVPMDQRLVTFYQAYYDQVLTRRWLRLFLFASLAEAAMAQTYIDEILSDILNLIVREAAVEAGLKASRNKAENREIAWVLHGAISHLAIRRHIYHNANPLPVEQVIATHVRYFLGGLRSELKAMSNKD